MGLKIRLQKSCSATLPEFPTWRLCDRSVHSDSNGRGRIHLRRPVDPPSLFPCSQTADHTFSGSVLHGACSRAVCDKFGVRYATSTKLTPPESFLALPINRRSFLHRYRRPPSGSLFAMPQAPVDLLNEKLASV